MAFFLIGRGPEDDLRLLSAKQFESRQAAMAELSILSADPAFDHWDADVSVIDLDSGVPVLLVRPAEAAVPQPVVVAGETGDADAWQADLPVVDATPAPAVVELVAPVAVEPEAVPDAIEAPFWEPPTVALIEPVGDPAIAEAIVAETAEPQPDVEAYPAMGTPLELEDFDVPVDMDSASAEPADAAESVQVEPVAETPAPSDDNDDLRAAILRTTQSMAAEGIVPPESVGAEEVSAELVSFADEAVLEPETPLVDFTPAPEIVAVAEEPAPEEPSGAVWPWDRSADTIEDDSQVPPEVAGVYDALEEPSQELPEPDVEAALRRPVLLGEMLDEVTDESAREPMSNLPADDVAVLTPVTPAEESDFILDLDSVEDESAPVLVAGEAATPEATEEPAPVEAAPVVPATGVAEDETSAHVGYSGGDSTPMAPAVSPLEDYTCSDCVYVDTCPNRDQRLPKDCGSFQWR